MSMKVSIDLPVIEGWEYTGECRGAESGEWYQCGFSVRQLLDGESLGYSVHIMRKKNKRGDWYYYINDRNHIYRDADDHDKVDDFRFELGNYFKTREEAYIVSLKVRLCYI